MITIPVIKNNNITKNHKTIFIFIISLIFFFSGFLFYNKFGSPEVINLLAKRNENIRQIKSRIVTNSSLIKNNPKNIKAWLELGDDFMETGQFVAASNSYKQAVLISNGNPDIIMSYVYSLIIGNDGKVSEHAKKSIDIVLMLQPKNEQARYFSAIYKIQSGEAKEAMKEMKDLYKSLDKDSPLRSMIDQQIGRK
ncbi:MAG: hypothetical protein R3D71_04650 [Rickettsiales bacterium]